LHNTAPLIKAHPKTIISKKLKHIIALDKIQQSESTATKLTES